ncbi:MAG: 6-phosphogluconolactonase [Verrucomicrobia bacterium]|nr:6-phosphogluconolactonase [Verrucomicrobiota bacterium]
MKTEKTTDYGRLIVGTREELFATAVDLAAAQQTKSAKNIFTWALTGGSTPQEWYRWCVTNRSIPDKLAQTAHFTVSDERVVPLHSEQSNFGNAERQLLTPLKVSTEQRHAWPVGVLPGEAASTYAREWHGRVGAGKTYNVCFLGMGDDGHTASIFPGSPLLSDGDSRLFAAVEIPGKGWRLTITPAGLGACDLVVVMTLGANKAAMLKRVLTGPHEPTVTPIQILRTTHHRVIWLADAAAAAKL